MSSADRARDGADAAPRVLVVGGHLSMLRACEDALGRSALVRTCLGARAAGRVLMTWDPSVIVLDHAPPTFDAFEILRSWHAAARSIPDVVLCSRASRESLDLLERRYAGIHVVPTAMVAGSLASTVLRAHRASTARQGSAATRSSGTRRRPREGA